MPKQKSRQILYPMLESNLRLAGVTSLAGTSASFHALAESDLHFDCKCGLAA